MGEVNNTSFDTQTNVQINAVIYNSTNKIIGNYTALSSLDTIRPSELSPFDIIIDNPQTADNSAYIEFSTVSQKGTSKPANLVLSVNNTFFDANGNPHITGNVVNHGQSPESNANIVGTFYNDLGLPIGTETFGINLGNSSLDKMDPFEIEISDNNTKSQAKSFSLNIQSAEDSMEYPINTKHPFIITTTTTNTNTDNLNSNNSQDSSDDNDNNHADTRDNKHNNDQRGKYLVDANGIHIYNKKNCSNKPGSSGGDSS